MARTGLVRWIGIRDKRLRAKLLISPILDELLKGVPHRNGMDVG
jgi:hypothetical protein